MDEHYCTNCKYFELLYVKEPCKTCIDVRHNGLNLSSKWEAKDNAR